MEILPLGPVVLIDTAVIDDEGELGELGIKKTMQDLNKTDVAVMVADVSFGLSDSEKDLINKFKEKDIKYIIAYNKCDLIAEIPNAKENEIEAVLILKSFLFLKICNMHL